MCFRAAAIACALPAVGLGACDGEGPGRNRHSIAIVLADPDGLRVNGRDLAPADARAAIRAAATAAPFERPGIRAMTVDIAIEAPAQGTWARLAPVIAACAVAGVGDLRIDGVAVKLPEDRPPYDQSPLVFSPAPIHRLDDLPALAVRLQTHPGYPLTIFAGDDARLDLWLAVLRTLARGGVPARFSTRPPDGGAPIEVRQRPDWEFPKLLPPPADRP